MLVYRMFETKGWFILKLGKKLIVTLIATTIATVGTFSGFCLAANSGEGAGQKIVKNVTASDIEKRLKEDLPKIIEEFKKNC